MVWHPRCGSSGVQVQCEAGEVPLQDQGSSSACSGSSGDIVVQFSLIYAFPLFKASTLSALQGRMEGILVILIALAWPRRTWYA